MPGFITTHSGIEFPVDDPQPEHINFDDIAHGLSLNCRFNGQCREFYSVAQHSCLVHDILTKSTTIRDRDRTAALRLALLHDASEAYITDLPKPFKRVMPEYRAKEESVQNMVEQAFDITPEDDVREAVKVADVMALAFEAWHLVPNFGRSTLNQWGLGWVDVESMIEDRYFHHCHQLHRTPWAPKLARSIFKNRWEILK